ncbi:hypothetical protein BVX97_00840, partial [bacterium E08(2017)]
MKKITVAIAGNPNAGKTTIFNNLTGGRHQVGNYPGVTVEKRVGTKSFEDYEIEFVDLPGTYGLTTWSLDEKVARDYIIKEQPDLIVDVIDASNLERNLYLTMQFMELELPLVLAFNMSDVAKAQGIEFDNELLEKNLSAEIVPMVGSRNVGGEELLKAIVRCYEAEHPDKRYNLEYGHDLEDAVAAMIDLIKSEKGLNEEYGQLMKTPAGPRWLALKLLEQDSVIGEKVKSEERKEALGEWTAGIHKLFGDAPAVMLADGRYGCISGA